LRLGALVAPALAVDREQGVKAPHVAGVPDSSTSSPSSSR